MAIFETGAVTSVPNLLDALVIFAAANGWTVNSNAIEGSGRRAHLQLSTDVFINLRALVNEMPQGHIQFGSNMNGLAINGSTGYSGAAAWHKQPGAPNDGVLSGGIDFRYRMAGMMGISGAIPAYYFHARGNMIYVWIEYATGLYQFMGFGKASKYGSWTGGTIFFANGEGHSNTLGTSTIGSTLIGAPNTGAPDMDYNENAFMYMDSIDGNTGWCAAGEQNTSPATTPSMPRFMCTFCLQTAMAANTANQFNSINVLMPCDLVVVRGSTAAWSTSSNFSVEGYLPDIHFICTRSLLAAQQLDDGSGNIFRIYPFRNKSAAPANSGWWGVAIKEN